MKKAAWTALLLALLPLVSSCDEYEDNAHFVIKTASGNEVVLSDGVKVHLLGLANTPANAEALQKQAVGQKVRLTFDSNLYPAETEKGSRIAAYVLTEQGTCLNRLLLKNNPDAIAAEAAPYDSLKAFTIAARQQTITQASTADTTTDAPSATVYAVPTHKTSDLSDLVDELEPAVFLINTDAGRQGTGFFVGPNGLAVSNEHVFKEASKWRATLSDGRRLPVVEIVEENSDLDYVIFRVGELANKQVYLRPASSTPRKASTVYVIGNPKGLEQSFTKGEVSALRTGENTGDIIQFSAPISPGSSGSPVLNPVGEVVGIATSYLKDSENCNFAVNIRLLRLQRFK